MTTSTALRASARAAFDALIDYAGLFPPATLTLADAQRAYQAARRGSYAWMLGRFIIPAPLAIAADASIEGPFSLIVDPDVDSLNAAGALRAQDVRIEALEIPLQKSISPFREVLSSDEVLDVVGALEADLTVAKLRDLPTYVELPWTPPWRAVMSEALETFARFELGAKMRCGGVTAESFPSVDDVAEFIAAAHAAKVPFKATAGLHHPIRHRDRSSGFMMHGFVNLIAAAALAPSVDGETVRQIVAEEDPGAFVFDADSFSWRGLRIGVEQIERTRREAFVSYGSCSFAEPVEDLVALGVLSLR
jgi:hypothetical protein